MTKKTEVDEINIKDLTKTIAKSTGTKNIQKAMKKQKDTTKMDLAALRKRLDALNASYATESVKLEEGVIDQVKDIVAKKQAKKIQGTLVDLFTASAISQIYDKVNDANKAKMDKLPITKLAHVAMKVMKSESVEELDVEQIDEISADLAKRALDKRDAQANRLGSAAKRADALKNRSLDKARQRRDREMGTNDRKDAEIKKHTDTAKRAAGVGNRLHHAARKADKKADKTWDYMKKRGMKTESVELDENRVDALAKDFHNRLKKAGNSDRNQNRERMATLAKAKKQGLSPIEMKQLDGKMIGVMNKMDGLVNEISAKKYHAALKGREYKRDRARNSAAANQFVGKDAEAQADMAKSKDHDRKLKKMKQMGINRTARNLGEASKEGTIRIIDLGRMGKGKGFQVQRMTKGKFVDQGKPYKSQKDAEKVRKDGQHSMQFEAAPKVDPAKYAAHMARHDKPKKMTSTQKSLADIRKKSESVSEKYKLHHKTMSAALQHAYDEAEKRGYEVDKDDIDRKVASGPRKPSSGKTNSYSLGLTKNGKPVKQKLQVQVYNMDNKGYELNMYVS